MAAIARDDAGAAFKIVDRVSIRGRKAGSFAAFELGAAANLAGYRQLAYGDFEGARVCLSIARVQGERGDAAFSRGYTIGLAGVNLMMQGQLGAALERFESGMAEQRMIIDRSHAFAALASCYIWGLYEANALDRVELLFGQYFDIITESALLDFMAVAQVSLARIHDVRGRPSKALAALDDAEAIGHANDWRRYLTTLGWERVRRALLSGDIEQAAAIAATMSPSRRTASEQWLQFSEDLEGESLGRIRLAIHTGDFDLAKSRLHTEFATQRGRIFRQIKLHLLEAQLQYRKGARNSAQRSLRKALHLGTPGRYIRRFLDEGESIVDMLREEFRSLADSAGRDAPQSVDRVFVEQLLRASGADFSHTAPTVSRPLEPLTDQEKRILIFLAKGVSNKEMASRLFVSENTIKFHLKHIYSKLAVTSRLHAIAIARDLGLVG
jgi:LuxR family maltose regulon positive regulatory protein